MAKTIKKSQLQESIRRYIKERLNREEEEMQNDVEVTDEPIGDISQRKAESTENSTVNSMVDVYNDLSKQNQAKRAEQFKIQIATPYMEQAGMSQEEIEELFPVEQKDQVTSNDPEM